MWHEDSSSNQDVSPLVFFSEDIIFDSLITLTCQRADEDEYRGFCEVVIKSVAFFFLMLYLDVSARTALFEGLAVCVCQVNKPKPSQKKS